VRQRGPVRPPAADVEVGGQFYPIEFGASVAAPIWKDLMTNAMEGLPPQPLP
jgi:hypothetical protein